MARVSSRCAFTSAMYASTSARHVACVMMVGVKSFLAFSFFMQVDICMTLLAERHQVLWIVCHLKSFQSLEVGEGHTVVHVDSGCDDALLRADLAGGVLVDVGQPHQFPLLCGVDLLPFLPLPLLLLFCPDLLQPSSPDRLLL